MNLRPHVFVPAMLALAAAIACAQGTLPSTPTAAPAATAAPQPVERTSDEPYVITGSIPFTSPFFLDGIAEPYVLLEDESGFVTRDKEFVFPLASQAIGPVELVEDGLLRYTLPLPARPLGTLVDVDNDGESDSGLMVFAVAYWSNTWGDPFLEARDGRGWSNAYTSARTDPYRQDEIDGGTLLIWAPDEAQAFPTDFGPDGLLFTADDPTGPVPAGYSLVDLDVIPFRIYREPEPEIDLLEGVVAVTDLSGEDYATAFETLFDKASREYPFTEDKGVDWQALHDAFSPRFAAADVLPRVLPRPQGFHPGHPRRPHRRLVRPGCLLHRFRRQLRHDSGGAERWPGDRPDGDRRDGRRGADTGGGGRNRTGGRDPRMGRPAGGPGPRRRRAFHRSALDVARQAPDAAGFPDPLSGRDDRLRSLPKPRRLAARGGAHRRSSTTTPSLPPSPTSATTRSPSRWRPRSWTNWAWGTSG